MACQFCVARDAKYILAADGRRRGGEADALHPAIRFSATYPLAASLPGAPPMHGSPQGLSSFPTAREPLVQRDASMCSIMPVVLSFLLMKWAFQMGGELSQDSMLLL